MILYQIVYDNIIESEKSERNSLEIQMLPE